MRGILLSLLSGAQLLLLSVVVWLKDTGAIQSHGVELEGQRGILALSAGLLFCSGVASFKFRRKHLVAGWVSFGLEVVTMFGLLASIPAIAQSPNKIGFLAPLLWSIGAMIVTGIVDVCAGLLTAHRNRHG